MGLKLRGSERNAVTSVPPYAPGDALSVGYRYSCCAQLHLHCHAASHGRMQVPRRKPVLPFAQFGKTWTRPFPSLDMLGFHVTPIYIAFILSFLNNLDNKSTSEKE